MHADRRYLVPGSETKDFIINEKKKKKAVAKYWCWFVSVFHIPSSLGVTHVQHLWKAALQKRALSMGSMLCMEVTISHLSGFLNENPVLRNSLGKCGHSLAFLPLLPSSPPHPTRLLRSVDGLPNNQIYATDLAIQAEVVLVTL